MEANTMYENLQAKLDINAIQIKNAQSYEITLRLALFGLLYLLEKHNRTTRESTSLQVMAGHLRTVLNLSLEMGDMEDVKVDYGKIEALIFKHSKWLQ